MLKIGISSCFFHPDPKRTTFSKKMLLYLEQSMAHWVMKLGAYPILLPTSSKDFSYSKIVSFTDGLLLHGGADLAPESYGEKPISDRWPGDAIRDQYEIDLYWEYRKQKKPVLGICRGAQLINVAHKGSLFQDLNTQNSASIKHRDADLYDKLFHSLDVKDESLLNQIYPDAEAKLTNSVHHQAIKDLGDQLVIEAVCPDDQIVEAIRLNETSLNKPDSEFVYAVQWHPEFMLDLDNSYLSATRLLDTFLQEIRLRQ